MTGVSISADATSTATAPAATATTATGNGTNTPAATTVPATSAVSLTPSTTPTAVDPAATAIPATDWTTGLEAHKSLIDSKGWKSNADMAKAYSELETKFSSTRPAEPPKSATEYDTFVKPPENAEKVGYNADFANWFKEAAFAHKVPPAMVGGLHDAFVKWAGEQMGTTQTASVEAMNNRVTAAGDDLRKAWGEPNTPTFARNVEMAGRAIRNLDPGLKQELIDVGALAVVDGKEMVVRPGIVKALSKVGATMFAEDTLFGRAMEGSNPFDPKTENVGHQGQIYREDPAKARALIMALPPMEQSRHSYLLSQINAKLAQK